ncbi:MAG: hypothetical protein M1823_007783, partial [Watsoniomyces obsoletus]
LKRQHSAEPLNSNGVPEARKSSKSGSPSAASTPQLGDDLSTSPSGPSLQIESRKPEDFMIGSPLKKQRSSMADFDDDFKRRLQRGLAAGNIGEILGWGSEPKASPSGLKFGGSLNKKEPDNDEEL